MRLKGGTAIVTGGSRGIGEQIVRKFVREGAATVFLDINREGGEALAKDLSPQGACYYVQGSVTEEADCRRAVQEAEGRFGPVTILANNAARFIFRSYEATPQEWRDSWEVNVMGTGLMTRAAVESMKKAGGGAIVNTGSISSFIAQSATMTYNSTKAALVEMTRCMALDLAPFNIRVNCICPGYILTPAFTGYVEEIGAAFDEVEKQLSKQTILNRLGKPEEIANCVAFLCSDEASYVTGAYLMADGGLTAL